MMKNSTRRWPYTLLLLLLTLTLSIGQAMASPASGFGHTESQAMMLCDHHMDESSPIDCTGWDDQCSDPHCHVVYSALPAANLHTSVAAASTPINALLPVVPDAPQATPWVVPIV
ncbi:hypothetical protein [Ferrimonas balearica]|uniref:hypothetical protein n=1 Tax=Ferrimonas balearica TaxID=44012 RepID=UPI001C9A0596|nr:hypothetical protein [Ferrimonas balearica]MBY5923376.1 hypothetical protein [Ferrimonas balearica]MBY5995334.1 hypothetical protein [Ferrimonas balearica]